MFMICDTVIIQTEPRPKKHNRLKTVQFNFTRFPRCRPTHHPVLQHLPVKIENDNKNNCRTSFRPAREIVFN